MELSPNHWEFEWTTSARPLIKQMLNTCKIVAKYFKGVKFIEYVFLVVVFERLQRLLVFSNSRFCMSHKSYDHTYTGFYHYSHNVLSIKAAIDALAGIRSLKYVQVQWSGPDLIDIGKLMEEVYKDEEE
jgi:hypothetical protein